MSKNTNTVVEETSSAEEAVPSTPPMTHVVISPDGSSVTVEGDRATVRAWMEERRGGLAKKENFIVQTEHVWSYRPKGPKVKMTPEEKEAAKVRRAAEREAKKAEKAAAREAKKAATAQRKAERAAEKERIKAEKAAGTYQVVKTKGGAKIAVKQPQMSTAQQQALARARAKIAANKGRR